MMCHMSTDLSPFCSMVVTTGQLNHWADGAMSRVYCVSACVLLTHLPRYAQDDESLRARWYVYLPTHAGMVYCAVDSFSREAHPTGWSIRTKDSTLAHRGLTRYLPTQPAFLSQGLLSVYACTRGPDASWAEAFALPGGFPPPS